MYIIEGLKTRVRLSPRPPILLKKLEKIKTNITMITFTLYFLGSLTVFLYLGAVEQNDE
jgi:hypothetical protein